VVIACDGVFDVMTNSDVIQFFSFHTGYTTNKPLYYDNDEVTSIYDSVMSEYQMNANAKQLDITTITSVYRNIITKTCDLLIHECFMKGSTDNMSVLIVILQPTILLHQTFSYINENDLSILFPFTLRYDSGSSLSSYMSALQIGNEMKEEGDNIHNNNQQTQGDTSTSDTNLDVTETPSSLQDSPLKGTKLFI
jgi:hypothetical protein